MLSAATRSIALAILLLFPIHAMAQTQTPPAPSASGTQLLKPQQLDQLVAPIALYPDPLLAEVLMASAYPLDIVQAERWLQSHKNLKGDQLKAAIGKEDWDDSIKSLMATPDVLAMMSEKLDWTEKLGDAVVAQQPDVMDAIQRLRAKAQANDKLQSTKQQKVVVNQVEGKQLIAIEPTDPETVYVPYYDPAVVYGGWPYPDYPPYYWPPPPYIGYGLLATGLAFGAGYALGSWWSGGYWGGNINWSGGGNNINITPPGNRPANPISGVGNGNRWQPRVDHQQAGNRGGQRDFRGNRGQQVLNPGGKPGNRPGAENRPSNRPSTKPGTKPGGGRTNVGSNRPNKGAHVSHRGQGQRQSSKARTSHRAANARPSHRAGGGRQHANIGRGGRGGGGLRAHGGGGRAAARGGGGRGGGGRGGGRRSDIRLKHDVALIGYLSNGLGLYRFSYNGSNTRYVGVIAQEVAQVAPEAITRGRDGYLRVYYDKLGVKFQRYDEWYASTNARLRAMEN
jgi:hypothetical protein